MKSEAELVAKSATTVANVGETISQFFEISRRRCSCNSAMNSTKIRSSYSGRYSVSSPVFSDVGNPLDIGIDPCTVLSVVNYSYVYICDLEYVRNAHQFGQPGAVQELNSVISITFFKF